MAGDEPPIIVRGDGCYLEDANGKRYLDALAGLFSVNIGYGYGEEMGEAAAAQMRELPFYTNWSYAHPRAIELASEVASLAPGDLNRPFFASGGPEETEEQFTNFLLDDLEETIEAGGPETICMVIMEPVQNAGGAFTPPEGYWRGVRELCDRYDILLCTDEVITGFGRLGAWFGSERYDIRPDLMTIAKGLSSSYASIGAVVATDRTMEPFMQDTKMYAHGITFGGHPVQAAVALKNIEIMKRDRIVENVADQQHAFRATLEQLLDLPIVGEVRGTGYFYAVELVKDKDTRASFDDDECETLLRDFLSPRLFERGLICRADDRGDPVVQISPPLIAGQEEFDKIVSILGDVLAEAWTRVGK